MNIFLDTSALIKLYHFETGSDKLRLFLQSYSNDLILTISDISRIEFHSAIMKKVRIDEITSSDIEQIFSLFDEDLSYFNIVTIDSSIIDLSIELIDKFSGSVNLRTLDSVQLAASIVSNSSLKIDFFLAADDILLQTADNYFKTFNPLL